MASGGFDGCWSFSAKSSELSSGQLLISEAGGLSQMGISGNANSGLSSGIAASNGQNNAKLIEILGLKYLPSRLRKIFGCPDGPGSLLLLELRLRDLGQINK